MPKWPPKTKDATVLCKICATRTLRLKDVPKTCEGNLWKKRERACRECWEAHLSMEIENKPAAEVSCMFCTNKFDEEEIKRFARKDTVVRYNTKRMEEGKRMCQNRCRNDLQDFDKDKDGRVFTCAFCNFETCVECDRPEHHRQSCTEYQTAMSATHGADERATATYCESEGLKRCPGCTILFEFKKPTTTCDYMQCSQCAFRFCGKCMVPWAGEGGVLLLGIKAHKEGCRYLDKADPTEHGLKRRFEEDAEAFEGAERKKKARKESKETMKTEGITPKKMKTKWQTSTPPKKDTGGGGGNSGSPAGLSQFDGAMDEEYVGSGYGTTAWGMREETGVDEPMDEDYNDDSEEDEEYDSDAPSPPDPIEATFQRYLAEQAANRVSGYLSDILSRPSAS